MVQAPGDLRWRVTLVVFAITLVAKFIGILLAAARKRVFSNAVSTVRRIVAAARSQERAAADEVAAEAAKRIRQQKVEHVRQVCQGVAVVAFPLHARSFLALARGESRASATCVQDGLWSLFHIITTITLICPGALSWRTIDVFYVALAAISGLCVAPLPPVSDFNAVTPDSFLQVLLVSNLFLAALSLARRDLYAVAPMNAAFAISSSTALRSYQGAFQFETGNPMFVQWIISLLVLAFTRMLEANWWALTMQGLAVRTSKRLLSAATALLRSYCDTVVEVDAEGVILVPARDLGSFLLRGPDHSLRGYRLVDLMADEEDRCAFAARLSAPRDGGMDSAESIPVRMRDGNGAVLKLHLLFFAFAHIDDSVRYMVGIRGNFPALGEHVQQPEQQQEARGADGDLEMAAAGSVAPTPRPLGRREAPGAGDTAPRPPLVAGAGSAAPRQLPSHSREMPRASRTGARSVEPPTPCSLGSGESSAALQAEESQESQDTVSEPSYAMRPILVLDAEGQGFPVLESSAGFRARVGRLPPSASLLDIVRDEGAVMAWMSRTLTCIRDRQPVPGPCELTFCLDHGQVEARCRVLKVADFYDARRAADAPSQEGSDDDSDLLRIELLFSRIRHRPGTRHQPRRRFRSAPPPALMSL